jgi:transcription elongation GreA/GreB family factor
MELVTTIVAALLAVQGVAMFRIINRMVRKKRAEEKLEDELARLITKDLKMLNRARNLARELTTGQQDPEHVAKAYKFLEEALKRLDKDERKAVLEAVLQPSERGRANYMSKVIRDSLTEATQQKAMSAGAR